MSFALVIFDCDGVLVDSEPLANRILSECFQAAGFPIDYDTCSRKMVGLSLQNCFKMAENWHKKPLPTDFFNTVQNRTYSAFRDKLKPIPGVRDAIESIPLPRCVASSSEHEKIVLCLNKTRLAPLFNDNLFSAQQVARGKPFPDLFLFAAKQMGFMPNNCVVIEDSPYGVTAARAAGMTVFGYTGSGFAEKLADEGAHIFNDMAELPQLLGFGR